MTKLHKAQFLDERGIEHKILSSGTMVALVKMTASDGNDCSEWIDALEVIEGIKEQEAYFASWKR